MAQAGKRRRERDSTHSGESIVEPFGIVAGAEGGVKRQSEREVLELPNSLPSPNREFRRGIKEIARDEPLTHGAWARTPAGGMLRRNAARP